MSMKLGKKDLSRIIAVLDQDHETMEDAAKAVMAEAESIFQDRAKFVVVGQLMETAEDGRIPHTDPRAIKLSLGWYSTEGDARNAAESLWHNTGSGDMFQTWWLPVFHGTPAEFHKQQRDKYAKDNEKRKSDLKERLQKQMEERRAEAEERAKDLRTPCVCGHEKGSHVQKKCITIQCGCIEFQEAEVEAA